MAQDVYIVGAARLPIGKFGGSLARLSLTELGTTAASAAIERSGIPAAEIDTAVASNVIPVIPSDLYISRKVAIDHASIHGDFAVSVFSCSGRVSDMHRKLSGRPN